MEQNDKKMNLKPKAYHSILEKAILSKLTFSPAASFANDMQTEVTDDDTVAISLKLEKAVWNDVYRNYDLGFSGERRRFLVSENLLDKEGFEYFFRYRFRKGGTVLDFHIYIEISTSNLSSVFDIKLSPELAVYRRDYKDLWELKEFCLQKVESFAETALLFRKYEFDSFLEAVSAFLINLGRPELLKEAEQLLGLTQAESFCGPNNFENLLEDHKITKIIPINYNEQTSSFEITFLKEDYHYFIIYKNCKKFWLFIKQKESRRVPYVTWCDYHGENQEAFLAEVLSPFREKKRKREGEDAEQSEVNRKLDFNSPKQQKQQKLCKSPIMDSDSFKTPQKVDEFKTPQTQKVDEFKTPQKVDEFKTPENECSNSDMLLDQPN